VNPVARPSIVARAFSVLWAVSLSALGWGCASTEFFNEGPGQPTDRASGQVPEGVLGVCKQPLSKRPPLVNEKLWENARTCTARTPPEYIRLGYGGENTSNASTDDAEMKRYLEALREGQKEEGGNNQLVAMLRALHDGGLKDPALRDRVSRESARTGVCDYTYLLNTMARERKKLSGDNPCASMAFDPKEKTEVCLFDTSVPEGVWLTSSWSCVTHTGAVGEAQSCFRLCGYDDYCAKQVACTAPDVDLLLCAMGVCIPEPGSVPGR